MLKGAGPLLLVFALFIDGLQALISLALFGVVSGVSIIPFVAVAAGPIGAVLGYAISVCLSISMGGALLVALAMNGLFYPTKLLPAFAELLPGINNGPVWTVVVVRSLMQKRKEERSTDTASINEPTVEESAQPGANRFSSAATVSRMWRAHQVPLAAATLGQPKQESRTPLKSFEGIKPANDNGPRHPYAQAA